MVAPGAKKGTAKNAAEKEARRLHAELLAPVEEQFSEFDVVWAKVPGFPWWPGVLFFSWLTVHAAGVQVGVKTELEIPGPEEVPVLDPGTGEETGTFRMQRHCLIMFLDKFNFSVVAVDPRSVASFTTHYQLHSHAILGAKKHPKKGEFRRALVKASELLHMGQDHTEEDLVLLEKPAPVEKKRRLQSSDEDDASLDDAWDDYTEEESAILSDDDDEGVATPKQSRRKASPAASRDRTAEAKKKKKSSGSRARSSSSQRTPKADVMLVADGKGSSSSRRKKTRVRALEAANDSDFDDAGMALVPAKARQKMAVAPPKESRSKVRKASRKEGRNAAHVAVVSPSASPIDLTGTPDSAEKKSLRGKPRSKAGGKILDKKKSRKKAPDARNVGHHKRNKQSRPKVLLLEASDEESRDAGTIERVEIIPDSEDDDEDGREKVTTPLASIWMDHASTSGSETQVAYQQDFLWDDAVFTDELSRKEKETAAAEQELAVAGEGRERPLSKRQSRSVQQSQIRQNLMMGNLDPHTMVQCAAYRAKDHVEKQNSRSRGAPTLDPPFQVVVHPDAVFVSDLHAHLATCEIIGFLGGKWDEATKTLYIQAAFPCRSLMIDGDDGSTDVEMDPESEIELRGIIQNAHLEVVGWYHSHPAFAPDPSVRDIENQASYQQLFQRRVASKGDNDRKETSEPFVGLIVGTYDTRRDTPVSLFRYFNVRGEQVSGGARREIYMPYELVPARRHYRSVLADEERQRIQHWPVYPSVLKHFGLKQEFVKVGAVPTLPTDGALSQDKMTKPMPKAGKTSAPERKRKQSLEAPGGKPPKKVKGKRGRKPEVRSEVKAEVEAEAPNQIDLTGDDNDNDEQDGHVSDAKMVDVAVSDAKTQEDKSDVQSPQTPEANVVSSKEATEVAQAPTSSTAGVSVSGADNDVEMEVVAEAAPTSLAESTNTTDSAAEPPSDSRAGASSTAAPSEKASSKYSSAPLTGSTKPAVGEANHDHSNGGDAEAKPSTGTTDGQSEGCGGPAVANGIAKESEKPSVGGEGAPSSGAASSTGPKQEIPVDKALRDVEAEVPRVVVDMVVSTASAPVNKPKNKRKSQQPQRVISAAQSNDMGNEESVRSREMQKLTQEMELKRHTETLDTSSRRKTRSPTKHPVGSQVSTSVKEGEASAESRQAEAANAATADKLLHTSAAPTRAGVSPAASTSSSGSSGRRRNRKPQKTVKNTHWTSSPRGDGSSQCNTTALSTPPAQALDDVFRTQGPRFSGGSTFHAASTSAAMDTAKPDSHLFDDDVEYIFAGEDVNTATSGDKSGESTAATPAAMPKPTAFKPSASSKPNGTANVQSDVSSSNTPSTSKYVRNAEEGEQKEATRINTEVRAFVTSMVDQVVTECIPRVAAATVEKLKQQAPEESKPATILASATLVQDDVKSEERVPVKKPKAEDVKMESVVDKVKPAQDPPAVLNAGEPPVVESLPVDMKNKPIQQTAELSASETPVDEPVKLETTSDKPPLETSGAAASNGETTPAAGTTLSPIVTAVDSVKEEIPGSSDMAMELPNAVSADNGAPASASTTRETETRVDSSIMVNGGVSKDEILPKASETVDTASTPVVATLFGSNRKCEDIQTSLEKMGRHLGSLKATKEEKPKLEAASCSKQDPSDAKQTWSSSGQSTSKDDARATVVTEPASELAGKTTMEQMHLDALRNKYGAGVSGCVAQVIALVDYYRDFGRRTALEDTWKPRMSKLAKIEASLSEYVNYINLPVALRQDFVKDLIGYLRQSWTTRTQRRRKSRLADRSGGE